MSIPKVFINFLRLLFKVKNAHTVTRASYCSVNTSTGRVESGGTGATQIPAGLIVTESDGIITNLTGNAGGTVKVSTENGIQVEAEVVGASADTDFMADVYMVDEKDLTLTPPTGSYPCGFVTRYISGTLCHVYLYSTAEMKLKKDLIDGLARVEALIPEGN